jgi:hypothetical protein
MFKILIEISILDSHFQAHRELYISVVKGYINLQLSPMELYAQIRMYEYIDCAD